MPITPKKKADLDRAVDRIEQQFFHPELTPPEERERLHREMNEKIRSMPLGDLLVATGLL